MELPNLIQKLEDLISSGTGVPTTGKILIDRDRLTDLLNQLRSSVPEDIQEAQDLLQMRENLINQALSESRLLRETAENDAKERISENSITVDALKEAESIIAEAQLKAQQILDAAQLETDAKRSGADQYAESTLVKLQEELTEIIDTIQNGIRAIDGKEKTSK